MHTYKCCLVWLTPLLCYQSYMRVIIGQPFVIILAPIGCKLNISVDLLLWPLPANAPVTLGSDYRAILKSDPILLIIKSELDVPILKIDKFAVTLLRFIWADCIVWKLRQWVVLRWSYKRCTMIVDDRTMIASQKHWLATFQKSALICEQDRKPVPTFFSRIRFCIWPKNRIRRSHDRWKNRVRPADFKIVR